MFIQSSLANYNVWFCPMLFSHPARNKHNVERCPAVWADLDNCQPERLLVEPTLVIETSPRRHQALWVLTEIAEPLVAEEVSKRIAYYHADEGADKSGWDLTQLLRVPNTFNYKYEPPSPVKLVAATDVLPIEDLEEAYPVVSADFDALFPFPGDDRIPDVQLLKRQHNKLFDSTTWALMQVPPDKDWSKSLWSLEMRLAEAGLEREEIFSIAKDAACNKYARDNRNELLLWREVCKAWAKNREKSAIIHDATVFKAPDLLSDEDLRAVDQDRTFIDEYIEWAKSVGDAAEAYHHAGAFTALSALVSGSVRLPTSFGTMVPNLWFLLLADTTLTRKSTALDLAVDMLVQVDANVIMATDGSIEGLFTALSVRPGEPSVFLRDEFSGLIEMMTKRDYYAGMAETLTKMYDGKFQKRVLRRETIEVIDPILIIFAGGIKTKILSLLDSEQVTSGFLPRFIFVTAMSDITRLQPLGPPNQTISVERERLVHILRQYKDRYQRTSTVKVGGVEVTTKSMYEARLTPESWLLYNEMERRLLETGMKDYDSTLLTPVMDRLAKSGLKAAVLISASRLRDEVVVTEADIKKAFSYVIKWRHYAMEVVSGIGLSSSERMISNVYNAILRNPGVMRSTVMSSYHLTKHEADNIIDTLEQRNMIDRQRTGRSERLSPVADE